MVYFYAKIYFHIKSIFRNSGVVAPSLPEAKPRKQSNGNANQKSKEESTKNREKETNAILWQFIIITMFFLGCWSLLAFIWILNSVFGVFVYNSTIDGVIGLSCHLNSAVNPVIYGFMNKKIRNAMFDQLPFGMKDYAYSTMYSNTSTAAKEKMESKHASTVDDAIPDSMISVPSRNDSMESVESGAEGRGGV
jgi:hypothetical protein